MYFADKSGARIASKDGKRMIIMESDFVMPGNIDQPLPIPGKGSAELGPVEIPGGFKADFFGISYKVHLKKLSPLRINFFRELKLYLGQIAVVPDYISGNRLLGFSIISEFNVNC